MRRGRKGERHLRQREQQVLRLESSFLPLKRFLRGTWERDWGVIYRDVTTGTAISTSICKHAITLSHTHTLVQRIVSHRQASVQNHSVQQSHTCTQNHNTTDTHSYQKENQHLPHSGTQKSKETRNT